MASWPDLRADELLVRLVDAGVDFVVIGGLAVILQGYERLTKDVDVVYSSHPANLSALGELLVELDARLYGVEEEVPFVADAATLRRTQILTLDTTLGRLDLLAAPAGAPPYDELRGRATEIVVGERAILVAAVDDLLAMKRAAGRPQDLADVEALEMIRRMTRRGRGG